jgi:branched chain amino acid efflux pump
MSPDAPLTATFMPGLWQRRLLRSPGDRAVTPASDSAPRVRDGVRAALPLAPSPILFGLSFGVLAKTAGMSLGAAVVMSATTFAGASQFAAISVIDAGGTILAAIAAAVFLNARYMAISITVASIFPGRKLRRLVESQAIVDESWALAARRQGSFDRSILIGSGIVFYVLWVGSTAAGTFVGDLLEDPDALGLDAAFAALFLAILVPYLKDRRAIQAAALAGAITFVLTPVAPAGVPIVAAATACLLGLRR